MTVQAGVWAITDRYSDYQIKQHLRIRRSSHRFGEFSDFGADKSSAVSDRNIERAREILKQLKIQTNL